jgi:hypothetical protein
MYAFLNTNALLHLVPASFHPVSASAETGIFNWATDFKKNSSDIQLYFGLLGVASVNKAIEMRNVSILAQVSQHIC